MILIQVIKFSFPTLYLTKFGALTGERRGGGRAEASHCENREEREAKPSPVSDGRTQGLASKAAAQKF